MASLTTFLKLLKKDPTVDGNDTFNVKTMLNDNWDKVDSAVGGHIGEGTVHITPNDRSNWDWAASEVTNVGDNLAQHTGTAPLDHPDDSVTDAKIGNRTINQGITAAFANVGTITQIISWFAKILKNITGKSNWYDTPSTTLEAANTHINAAAPHSGHVSHSLATAANDFLVASGADRFVKKTLTEVKSILGLGSAAYTASTAYTPSSHTADAAGKHNAANISVADSSNYFTATDVEGVLSELFIFTNRCNPNLLPNYTGILGFRNWREAPITGRFGLSRSGDDGGICFVHTGAVEIAKYECVDSDKIAAQENIYLTLSADMYAVGITGGVVATEIHYLKADNSTINFERILCPNNSYWQRYRKTVKTPPETAYVLIRLVAGNGTNATSKAWKNIKLEYGTMETPINQYSDLTQLFCLANDGKTSVANAIAAMGVSASPTDTFSTLATKIGQISTGKKWASATITPVNNVGTVNNLTFTPSLVYATYITGTTTYFSVMRNTGNAGDKIMGLAIQSGGNGSLPTWMSSGQFLSNGFTMQFGVNQTYNWIAIE